MALQSTINVDIDFYDKKYTLINAKQFDKSSRFLSVTCYNHGEIFHINSGEHSAYVRYRKADENGVFNFCDIQKGKIIVELTEQMLAVDGICYADLVIVNKGHASVDKNTGEIVTIDNSAILSTMTFCVDVAESAILNSDIESSYEHDALNKMIEKAEAEYTEVIQLSKSYAVGNAGGIRNNEDTDNAKYYYEQSSTNANNASISATNALQSERNAKDSETNSEINKNTTKTYMDNSKTYMDSAVQAAQNSSNSAASASASENAAKEYANNAKSSMTSASDSASAASNSETKAYNYYLQTEAITNGLNGAFLPMGTVAFAQLAELKNSNLVSAGYLYNISDNFVTDATFKIGAGVSYDAGANVYYTADGYWDVLTGTTVTGVKGAKETVYRKGNVDLTPENIGAVSIDNVATVDEVKNYLGINDSI